MLLGWTDGPIVTEPPSSLALDPFWALSTVGWSGATGFLRCAVTNSAEATVAPTVKMVAAAFSTNGRKVRP